MKLFRQKDELFEIMGKAAERRRGSTLAQGPSAIAAPKALATSASTSASHAPPTPPPAAAGAEPAPAAASEPATRSPSTSTSTSASMSTSTSTSAPALTPKKPVDRPTLKLPMRPPGATAAGARPSPKTTAPTRRLPKAPPGFGGPDVGDTDDDLFEIDGDALVVVDDGWEDAPAVAAGGTFAIRADTAIVGGLLAGGLLITAFFIGRTTTGPDVPAERPIAPVVIQTVSAEPSPQGQQQQQPSIPGQTPAGPLALAAGARPNAAASVAAGFQQQQQQPSTGSTTAAPTPPPVSDATPPKGKYELRVCTTTADKAAAVAQWLNAAPRSPIFGRGDLKATVTNGGSVKIHGFAQREPDVLSRVKATSDPTNGGSGTFCDAFYASVRN